MVTMCYQRYQVLHEYVMYCYLSYLVGTCGYQCYLVLQDPWLYTWSTGQHKLGGVDNQCGEIISIIHLLFSLVSTPAYRN